LCNTDSFNAEAPTLEGASKLVQMPRSGFQRAARDETSGARSNRPSALKLQQKPFQTFHVWLFSSGRSAAIQEF